MLKYLLPIILLTSLAYGQDLNTTSLRVFWKHFQRDFKIILITGGKDLEKAVGYQGDLKINSFITFKPNNQVDDNDLDVTESYLIENSSVTENYTDIYNEVHENEIDNDGKNSVTEKNYVQQAEIATVIDLNDTQSSWDDKKVTLTEAWNIFSEKLKLFLLQRDIELSIPKNYFTLDKYLRISFKNVIANGGMVKLKLVNNTRNKSTFEGEDKIDKITREDIDFELPAKISVLFNDITSVFFSFIYMVPTFLFSLTFPSLLFFPFIFLRKLITFYFFTSSK